MRAAIWKDTDKAGLRGQADREGRPRVIRSKKPRNRSADKSAEDELQQSGSMCKKLLIDVLRATEDSVLTFCVAQRRTASIEMLASWEDVAMCRLAIQLG